MTKNNLVKKVLSETKNFAKKMVIGTSLVALPFLYSNNANAQKAEEAQKFGTAIIGGKPATVSLSEYIGTGYLSVPTDNELGREFYPFLTLRGKNDKGKDTTNIVSWKTREGIMEDLKSEVVYVPKKMEGKYLIKMNKDGVLGIKPTDATTSKDGDVITGNVKYESGKIEDVIRTVKFPDETNLYYLFYRDHTVDSSEVPNGKKTPFVLVKKCGDKEPLYFSGEEAYFEGEVFEFVANDASKLEKIVDKDKKSLIYSEQYLEENKSEIEKIRESDRSLQSLDQKRGIPGHVKEFLEGKLCDSKSEKGEGKEKSTSKVNGRIKLGAGYTVPKGFEVSINPQIKLGEKAFLGPYFSYSNSTRFLEKFTQEEGLRIIVSVPAQMYFVNAGSEITENNKITTNKGLGLNFSYVNPSWEAFVKAGLLGQKRERTLTSIGKEYMEVAGVASDAQTYSETDITITNKSLFGGAPFYVGAGAEYFPLKGKKILGNFSVAGEFGYIFEENSLGLALGSLGIKCTFGKSKDLPKDKLEDKLKK